MENLFLFNETHFVYSLLLLDYKCGEDCGKTVSNVEQRPTEMCGLVL